MEASGESSQKLQENGDASTESERPLKKARFAWQVKGKYHLKNDKPETATKASHETPYTDFGVASSSKENFSSTQDFTHKESIITLDDYFLQDNFNAFSPVIQENDKLHIKPSASLSRKEANYAIFSSNENSKNGLLNKSFDSTSELLEAVPISSIHTYTEDVIIAKWQAKQTAKGLMENTINRVLETWMCEPSHVGGESSRVLALDVADFINNLPGDNTVENEGILMAISAHGLQNTSSSNSNDTEDYSDLNTDLYNFSSPQRTSSPILTDPDNNTVNETRQTCDKIMSDDLMSWSYTEDNKEDLFPDSYPYYNENPLRETNIQNIKEGTSSDYHCDFMDAAVLFAIQNKGLTTFGTDYG